MGSENPRLYRSCGGRGRPGGHEPVELAWPRAVRVAPDRVCAGGRTADPVPGPVWGIARRPCPALALAVAAPGTTATADAGGTRAASGPDERPLGRAPASS